MRPGWALLIAAIVTGQSDGPHSAWVSADIVDVLDVPDDAAFSTGRLARGRRVTVRREGPDGWLTIAPPEGSFSLVQESDLEDLGDETARVIPRFSSVRPGRDGARIPGPPHVTLKRGTIVRLLDRRPLVVRQEGETRTWIAIAPPRAEVRFVRADAMTDVEVDGEAHASRRDRLASSRASTELSRPPAAEARPFEPPALGPIAPDFMAVAPDRSESDLPPDVSEELGRIAARHREILKQPIDRWKLAPIEEAYAKSLRGGLDAGARAAVEWRLGQVRRQRAAASAAARLAALVRTSQARDGQVRDASRAGTREVNDADRDYDATGMLQTSSRMVNGRRVHALLGDDGGVVAFLTIPPGLAVNSLLSHRVGVRGEGHYDEALRARLILVRDVERLVIPR